MAETGTGKRVAVAMAAALLAGSAALWVTAESDPPQTDGRAVLAQEAPIVPAASRPLAAPGSPGTRRAAPDRVIPARLADLTAVSKGQSTGDAPTKLTIARLDISMRVIPVGVDAANAMSMPEDPNVAGWYRFGPRPADTAGATVISGHLDTATSGIGPLSRIKTARKGDRIVVGGGSSSTIYSVESVSRIPKSKLDLSKVFNRDSSPRLHLLTCGGDFDKKTGHYEDNILVIARIATS